MRNRIGARRRARLLKELARGDRDVWAIAESYKLSLEDLAHWASLPENERVLGALRRLCDQQAQTTLSRYRTHAAARLAAIAMGEVTKEDDVTRRTCMDVLKTRVGQASPTAIDGDGGGVDVDEVLRDIDAAQRAAMGLE